MGRVHIPHPNRSVKIFCQWNGVDSCLVPDALRTRHGRIRRQAAEIGKAYVGTMVGDPSFNASGNASDARISDVIIDVAEEHERAAAQGEGPDGVEPGAQGLMKDLADRCISSVRVVREMREMGPENQLLVG